MKTAKLYSFSDIRIEDIPIPKIGNKDALIKTKACGICSGDVMPWYIEKKAPLVLGHEPVGEIIEIGKECNFLPNFKLKVNDRVFVHHHAPCLNCKYCQRGDYVQCETWKKSRIIPGGISEYIVVPENILLNDTLKLPDHITYEDGVLIEPTACVVKSLRRSIIKKGDTVLVIGLGVMGQIHIMLAREYGAKIIIGADMVPFRLQKAIEFGSDYVINVSKEELYERVKDITSGFMADIVIVCPNSVDAIKDGLKVVSHGGTVLIFTPSKPNEMLDININEIYFKDINIVTSYSCGPDDTKIALDFISKGIIKAEKLITHRFSIDDTDRAYRITAEARDSLKCAIIFN